MLETHIETNVVIRTAQPDDITTIMELIQLKAEFDGCPESVEATPQKLTTDLFGEKPLAFVLLAGSCAKKNGIKTLPSLD